MWFVYIIQSEKSGRYYVGYSGDVQKRLDAHNRGEVAATRHLRPWVIAYTEAHNDATSARKREWHLKRQKSRKVLEALISSVG